MLNTDVLKFSPDKRRRIPGVEARSEFLDTGRLMGSDLSVVYSGIALLSMIWTLPNFVCARPWRL
jgi:hypothetical protein